MQLSSLFRAGIDTQYILTGERIKRAEAKRLGVLTSGTKDIFDKFEAEDDGDESRDDELFNVNTPPIYALAKIGTMNLLLGRLKKMIH